MRNLIFFVTIFVCFNSIAKPEIDTIIIADNSKKIIFKCDTEKIYFFCPINSLSKEVYLEKFEKFFKKRNIQSLDKLNFCIVFYKMGISKSKGLNINFQKIDTTILINDFSVIFQNFEKSKLEKTGKRIEIDKYYNTSFFSNTNLARVSIEESVTCFNSYDERIPVYENYISQLINPVYSDSEKIIMLNDELKITNTKVDELLKQQQLLFNQINNLIEKIKQIENQPLENKNNSKKTLNLDNIRDEKE